MNRRTFVQTVAGTVASTCALTHSSASQDEASKSSPPEAPFQLSVMLWTVFTNLPFEQRLEKVAEAGYKNVELVGEYDNWTEADFNSANAKSKPLGIHFDCTAGPAGLNPGVTPPAHREPLLEEIRRPLPIMEKLDCPSLILLSGNTVPGM